MTLQQSQTFEDEAWNLGMYQTNAGWTLVVEEARNTEREFDNYYDLKDWAEGV